MGSNKRTILNIRLGACLVALLMVCIMGGFAGNFVDIDHLLAKLWGIKDGRFLHLPFALVAIAGIVGFTWSIVSYYRGLATSGVLRRGK
ncbi:MAG: hypothetical protein KAR06_02905 [Deltaproteobacteria bacterium]|nr:hypothetical protein [Deltaproteobacteria bacterium]